MLYPLLEDSKSDSASLGFWYFFKKKKLTGKYETVLGHAFLSKHHCFSFCFIKAKDDIKVVCVCVCAWMWEKRIEEESEQNKGKEKLKNKDIGCC